MPTENSLYRNDRRQGEQMYNKELHDIYLTTKNLVNMRHIPQMDEEHMPVGSLWLNDLGELLFYDDDRSWKKIFDGKMITSDQISVSEMPEGNIQKGQLWISSDGSLYYYNGNGWQLVKADQSTETGIFTNAAFENFLLIPELNQAGETVVQGNTEKVQLQLPNVEQDRFFIDGKLVTDYDKVSNIAIQYPASEIEGKTTSAVHVNPIRAIGVTKRLVLVDKQAEEQQIAISETNTEFYGFNGQFGELLTSDHYTSYKNGIKLTQAAINAYDFILAATYRFGNTKNVGSSFKVKQKLSSENSIYIGSVGDADKLLVFINGLCFENTLENYIYEDEYIKFKLDMPTKMDVTVTEMGIRESGLLDANGSFEPTHAYEKPIVFANAIINSDHQQAGLEVSLVDFTINAGRYYIENGVEGMSYTIVEAKDIFVDNGIVDAPTNGESPRIPAIEGITEDEIPLIFVDGILIAQADIAKNADNSYFINGLKAGQRYTAFKIDKTNLYFEGPVYYTTIPTDTMDDAMVYIQSKLVCDMSATQESVLPVDACNNEIKSVVEDGLQTWKIYNASDREWVTINNEDVLALIQNTSESYLSNKKAINILKRFEPNTVTPTSANASTDLITAAGHEFKNRQEVVVKQASGSLPGGLQENKSYFVRISSSDPNKFYLHTDKDLEENSMVNITANGTTGWEIEEVLYCEASAILFSNSVEKPLLSNSMVLENGVTDYYVNNAHGYIPGDNSLSVYLNGIRQYNVEEMTGTMFRLPEPIIISDQEENPIKLLYFVELKERGESAACERQVLTSANKIDGIPNAYSTDIQLYPGVVKVYINGYRQPSSAYSIIDAYTIVFKDTIEKENSDIKAEILIEVRQDYNIREITVPIKYAGQNTWRADTDGIPLSMFDTQDTIGIYINGAAYGKEYSLNRETKTITLLNKDVTNSLGIDPLDMYFKKYPSKYEQWKEKNNLTEYRAKPITDVITFEWR